MALLILVALPNTGSADPPEGQVSLWGEAKGGTLEIYFLTGRNPVSATIETEAGEDAVTVAQRLSRAINDSELLAHSKITSTADENTLTVTCSEDSIALRGSETGLGIPPPPKHFSGVLDTGNRTIHLSWENPPGGYDAIFGTESGGFIFRLSGDWGDAEACDDPIIPETISPAFTATRRYALIGRRNGTPSDVATCSVEICQEFSDLLDGDPYVEGVAPDWHGWDISQGTATVTFARGPEKGRPRMDIDSRYPPGYQVISGIGDAMNTFEGGVWRRFTGLNPGHEYWIQAYPWLPFGVPQGGDWWYSLHAAHNGPSGADLTVDQLAGLAPLPDGTRGPAAGQIVRMDPALGGHYGTAHTAIDSLQGRKIGNITLPENVSSLTVWVKYGGNTEFPGVGLDWVIVKDVTCLD